MGLMHRESSESNALRRMRFSITLSCIFITAAFLIHILIWGFASFTDIRFVRSDAGIPQRNPAVIVRGQDLADASGSALQMKPKPVPDQSANHELSSSSLPDTPGTQLLDAHLEFSSADSLLRIIYQLSTALAWIGVVLLLVETSLAVVVAGGINAPGISYVVQSQLWACLLLTLVIPWDYFMSSFPIPSFLSDYSSMTLLAEPFRVHDPQSISPLIFFSRFLLMPVVVLVVAGWIAWLYHKGTAAVIEKSGPTDFEIAIEEETTGRKAGSVIYGGRARGALQLAVPTENSASADDLQSENAPVPVEEHITSIPIKKRKKKHITLNTGTGKGVSSTDESRTDAITTEPSELSSDLPFSSPDDEPHRRPI